MEPPLNDANNNFEDVLQKQDALQEMHIQREQETAWVEQWHYVITSSWIMGLLTAFATFFLLLALAPPFLYVADAYGHRELAWSRLFMWSLIAGVIVFVAPHVIRLFHMFG